MLLLRSLSELLSEYNDIEIEVLFLKYFRRNSIRQHRIFPAPWSLGRPNTVSRKATGKEKFQLMQQILKYIYRF